MGKKAADKPGHTRWYCYRCKRPLVNDPCLKQNDYKDTVSPVDKVACERFIHDACKGEVALSVREA